MKVHGIEDVTDISSLKIVCQCAQACQNLWFKIWLCWSYSKSSEILKFDLKLNVKNIDDFSKDC